MSGGSYDYLYSAFDGGGDTTIGALLGKVQDMAERCEEWGKPEAALALHAFAHLAKHLQEEGERLAPLLKAVEWVRSCDWGPNDIDEVMSQLATTRRES